MAGSSPQSTIKTCQKPAGKAGKKMAFGSKEVILESQSAKTAVILKSQSAKTAVRVFPVSAVKKSTSTRHGGGLLVAVMNGWRRGAW
mmetsp:Transcript_112181/g.198712  ORF Transcript_112181/g.198712 Transcript_112181/m.198712 type:complete len:87 (+) Transcript_112181:2872-3132(+)